MIDRLVLDGAAASASGRTTVQNTNLGGLGALTSGNGIEVIAGVNLPMLIKLAGVRGENNMEKALIDASEAGRKYINVASRVLSGK